tara:strand:- start:9949 stop:11601 length:1653 start_codon:yes stop_codon:yes gene_type:complete
MLVALVLLLTTAGAASGQTAADQKLGLSTFNVFIGSTLAGIERVTLNRSTAGWIITSSGQLSPPIELLNRNLEIEYDDNWEPRQLIMDGRRQNEDFLVRTSFSDGFATNSITDGSTIEELGETVNANSIILPDYFFGSYEALAIRLETRSEGNPIPTYNALHGAGNVTVLETIRRRLEISQRPQDIAVYQLAVEQAERTLNVEMWVDEDRRLLRVKLPTANLDVMRQDLSLVSTRLNGVDLPGDSAERIPMTGFSVAATITTPVDREVPRSGWPVVILTPGTRSIDRDEHLFGVPIFAQLAAELSENGYLVVRYDKRGVGQSGGRPESAKIEDYADDARAVINRVRSRSDVDRSRITLLAHGEGGWIGLKAAAEDNGVSALVLLATPSVDGATLILEQQAMEFDRLELSDQDRAEYAALQHKIHAAVVGDGDWTGVPNTIRRQADTPWFRSFIEFQPADTIRQVNQPILILHGALDQHISSRHANELGALAERRSRSGATVDVVTLDGINHLLSESVLNDNYPDQTDARVAKTVSESVINWLGQTLKLNP